MADDLLAALPDITPHTLDALQKANVHTPQQLLGHFLALRLPGADVRQHCYYFWYWMHTCGLPPLQRALLMDYVGELANRAFPGSYDPSVFAE